MKKIDKSGKVEAALKLFKDAQKRDPYLTMQKFVRDDRKLRELFPDHREFRTVTENLLKEAAQHEFKVRALR